MMVCKEIIFSCADFCEIFSSGGEFSHAYPPRLVFRQFCKKSDTNLSCFGEVLFLLIMDSIYEFVVIGEQIGLPALETCTSFSAQNLSAMTSGNFME